VEIAARYDELGADELCFLDITASSDERDILLHVIEAVAARGFSFRSPSAAACARSRTCGGCSTPAPTRCRSTPRRCTTRAGARSLEHRRQPGIVVAIDAKKNGAAGRSSPTAAARRPASTPCSGRKRMQAAGAGEILLTSMDRDGTRDGFDLGLTRAVSEAVSVPVVASGGVGPRAPSPTACSKAAPTPCSRRASSTSATSPCARQGAHAARGIEVEA
jgi:cyclase